MRKVEQQMLWYLTRGRTFRKGNTYVDGEGNVYLHGNHIARNVTRGGFEYRWAGWRTCTTSSRLNAILRWSNVNYKRDVPARIDGEDLYAWHKLGE